MDKATLENPFGQRTYPFERVLSGDPDARSDLRCLIDTHRFTRPRGTILKMEGDLCSCVYFLLSGWMALSKSTRDGHRQIIDILLPGEALDPTLAHGRSSAVQIESFADVEYAAVPHQAWTRLRRAYPALTDAADRMTASAFLRMSERVLRLGKGSAASMIAFALCELCIRSAPPCLIEGKRYRIPMTQTQLGDFCGLSAVHVCRIVRGFKRSGVLEASDHMDIVIRDVGALAEIAEIDPDTFHNEFVPAA